MAISTTIKPRVTASSQLRERIKVCRPYPSQLREQILKRHPNYDSYIGGQRIERVLALRASDIVLTTIIEQLCAEYNAHGGWITHEGGL